jgi:RNA polymerase sigma factor for flagellar operon FliA
MLRYNTKVRHRLNRCALNGAYPLSSELTPKELFLAHLDHIEKVARHACRRRGFSPEETDEFVSCVHEKMIADDYAVIRKFQGKSSLKTYLTVVIERLLLDHLNHLRGKWRPSAEAERLGPLAIQLDTMLYRDGISLDETCEILRTNHHVEASIQELHDLAAKLPYRNPPRRMKGEEVLENRPAEERTPEETFLALEAGRRKRQILRILKDAMRKLPPDDGLLAKMSCELKISQIARTLKLEQKPLYRRLEKIFKTLRQDLESEGVRPDEIGGLLGGAEDDDEPRH